MEERFVQEQVTHRHNLEFLVNVIANEIGRIEHIPLNTVPNDQNNVNSGAIMDYDENEEVTLINVIQLKRFSSKIGTWI